MSLNVSIWAKHFAHTSVLILITALPNGVLIQILMGKKLRLMELSILCSHTGGG